MEAYYPVIAAFINSVLVLLIVQGLKNLVPKMKEKVPWLIPILAGAFGPAVAAAQNALFAWLGVPIDLSPLEGIFTGGAAVAIYQVGKQTHKGGSVTGAAKMILLFALCAMLSAPLTGCATLGIGGGETSFTKLTQDEQARVLVGGFQDATGVLFDVGKIYITAQPQYALQWKEGVVPGFDQLNKLLADLQVTGSSGQAITAQLVVAKLQTRVVDIVAIYTKWGTIPSGSKEKATPDQIALLIISALQGGSILIDQLMNTSGGTIPTWETIIAKNGLLQAKIDAEK